MANIAFVSVYDRNAYGLRLMSANLKKHGHQCSIVFLKRYDTNPTYRMDLEVGEYPWMGVAKSGRVFKYASNSQISDVELGLLKDALAEIKPDLIGMTVNTPLRVQNVKVTRFLRNHFKTPIMWGGYDPTVNAEDCLELCDYCCIGEGDDTILEVAKRIDEGRSFEDVGNLAFRRDGATVTNPKYPVEQDLDRFPWRDDSPEDKYFIEDGRLERNCPTINDRAKGVYQTMTARGCPYKCTYCCEATFKDLYRGEVFLRRRSAADVVAELAAAKQRYGLHTIHFEDEIFGMNIKWLEEFAPLYKRDVGLPFTAYIYPTRNIEKLLALMKDAGLNYCCLALESGSVRINKKVFDRVYDRELFLLTAKTCKALGLRFYTDVITYNPYEQEEDLQATLDVLVEMGGGFDMAINKLFVLPGTKMSEQMKKEGVPPADSSRDRLFNYYCRLFWIASLSPRSKKVVRWIQGMPIFKRRPELLRTGFVEALLSPRTAIVAAARARLPRKMVKAIQGRRARARASVAHATSGAQTADAARDTLAQVVCR